MRPGRGLGYQLAEGIALLSKVDWRAKGLGDLGRPDGFHERQVDRWTAFLDRIKGRELPGFDVAAGWLRAHRPLDYIPGVMHGDYQFANVMFRHGAPARLAAIVDWEMGTVGDPKLDLAWMVQSWPEDTSSPTASFSSYADLSGMPPWSALLAHYAEVSGRQVDDIDYYLILAKWKLAVVLEQGFQRAGDEGVSHLAVGDRVCGTAMVGAFGEEIVATAAAVRRIPDGVDDLVAAAFGVAHRTAYHVLKSVAALQPGEELVVLGAGGGAGLAAVQLGSVLGATVTAVASSAGKLEVAAGYRATRLICHRPGELRQALREALPDGANVVVDPVGGDLAEPALRAMRWGGRFVTVGYASGAIPRIPLNLVLLKGVHLIGFQLRDFAAHAPDELRRNEQELQDMLIAHRAVPHIGATFDLTETAAALRHVADGKAIGKVVLFVNRRSTG